MCSISLKGYFWGGCESYVFPLTSSDVIWGYKLTFYNAAQFFLHNVGTVILWVLKRSSEIV